MNAARKPVGSMMFWRLPNGTVAMLAFGYAGKINEFATSVGPRFLMIKSLGYAGGVGAINAWTGLAIGICDGLSLSSSSSRPATRRQNSQTPLGRLSTTCALSSLLDEPSILLATYFAHSPMLWILSCSM